MSGAKGGRGGTGRNRRGDGATPRRGAPADRSRSDRPGSGKAGGARAGASAAARTPGRPRSSGGPGGRARSPERGLGGTQVEGRQAVRELLLAGRRKVIEVLISAEMERSEIIEDIVELAHDLKVPVHELSRKRLDAASHTEASQGVVARAHPLPETPLSELVRAKGSTAPFLVALDGVTDPGNLGAIIRTAECAGVSGIVLPRHRAVHVTPTVTKASAGAVEHVDLAVVGGLPTAIAEMQRCGVWVVGLDARGERSVQQLERADVPICLVFGAEGAGLSRLVRQRCDDVASIPLRGSLSSLNVATAAAVAMYEIVRQRDLGGEHRS